MKEDYLWDKNGSDPEIERLEKALLVFRYQETEPPALPAKIIPFERKQPRNFLRLAFSFAACAAVVAICLGVWLQASNDKIEVAKDFSPVIEPKIVEKTVNAVPIKKSADLIPEKAEVPQMADKPQIIKVKKSVQPIERKNKAIARTVRIKKSDVQLTKDEQYAYDQLMLALSITSSKFKLVKDKVDGIEEKSAVRQNAR